MREEMDAIGGQELSFPALLPREPYEATNRWTEYGDNLFRLQDRKGVDMLLGPTHEEMFTLAVKDMFSSYKELPLTLYQIQTKYRDEARPRAGLLRGREFIMKDSYSFDVDDAGLEAAYQRHREAYVKIFDRLGFDYVIVYADSGAMGGSASEEFLAISPRSARTPSCAAPTATTPPTWRPSRCARPTRSPYDDAPAAHAGADARHARPSPRWSTTSTRRTPRRPDLDGGGHAQERRRHAHPPGRHEGAAGDRPARRPRGRRQAARRPARSRSRSSRWTRPRCASTPAWSRATSARVCSVRSPTPASATSSTRASSRAPVG